MKIFSNLPMTALFTIGLLTLSLSSCIFTTGVPMVETEVLSQNNKTWKFTISKLIPTKGFNYMAIDSPISIRVSNSFSPDSFGTVSIKKTDGSVTEFINGINCTMRYKNGAKPNDTLIIENHDLSTSPTLTVSTAYSSITLTNFNDFKGNVLPPIEKPDYSFETIGRSPYLLAMSPGHYGGLSSSPIKLTFNKTIGPNAWGTIVLQTRNSNIGNSGKVVLKTGASGNSDMSPQTTTFYCDTVLIKPKANVLPANIYTVLSITDFKDKNGYTQSYSPTAPAPQTGSYKIDVYGKLAAYSFSNGDLNDSSLNGYNLSASAGGGHVAGSPAPDRTGAIDMAIDFDGSRNALSSSYLKRIYNLRLNSTITTWFSPNIPAGTDSMPIFFKTGLTTGIGYNKAELLLELKKSSNGYYYLRAIAGENSPGHKIVTSSTPLTSGNWYHAAVVLKHNTISLYLNGQLQQIVNFPQGKERIRNLSSSFLIGKSDLTTRGYYKGLIDELTVYNYSLTDKAIQAEYNSTKPGP